VHKTMSERVSEWLT